MTTPGYWLCTKHDPIPGPGCEKCKAEKITDLAVREFKGIDWGKGDDQSVVTTHFTPLSAEKCRSWSEKIRELAVRNLNEALRETTWIREAETMKTPTEQQLNDPAWWDENAPEWARSFGFAGIQRLPVFFNTKQYQYLYGNRQVIPVGERQTFSLGDIEHAAQRPTKPAAPEWNGEGLPPVGCECEFEYLEVGNWMPARVIGYDGPACVVAIDGYGYQGSTSCGDFRPLRTKEQRERDELQEIISDAYESGVGVIAAEVIAAGWRKGE